jgi:phosphohistidine phosphatase SixA
MTIIARWCAFLAAALLAATFAPLQASAQVDPGLMEAVKALRAGGHVIVFRHGATHQDQADTDPLNLTNIDKQRHLNDGGRAVARQVGEAFRKLQIPVGQVQTSQFHRAIETGTLLGFGAPATSSDITEGGLVVTPTENNRRAAALRKLAGTAPVTGTNVVIVSHKPNIMDAFGKDWFDLREGEASVFKPEGNGYRLVARLQATDWSKLAQAAN